MLSRALTSCRSLVFPWDLASCHNCRLRPSSHREGSPPRKRTKHVASAELDDLSPLPSLEAVNVDVFRLIADELHHQGGSLHNLSLSSRKLRYLSSSILFSRCKWLVLSSWGESGLVYTYSPAAEPPEAIRPFVRHLKVYRPFQYDQDGEAFHTLLDYLPSITSVTFAGTQGLISWPVIRSCLVNPRITSLSFDARSTDRFDSSPYLTDDAVTSSLERLTFTTTMWREYANKMPYTGVRRLITSTRDMKEVYRIEREWLAAILFTMNNTATSVIIPIETAPLQEMSTLPWPRLRHLSLRGRFLDGTQTAALRNFLPTLSSLETLLVQAARSKQLGRPRLLAPLDSSNVHGASSSSPSSYSPPAASSLSSVIVKQPPNPPAILPRLRSLTIAFPSPEDSIFSINAELTQLSLTDCPRFYNFFAYGGEHIGPQWGWNPPILSPAQCLSIMRRMPLSRLTKLELVYMVPAAQSLPDLGLLTYIGTALPALAHLEIHRYRFNRTERVNHIAIARALTAVKSLRTLRLNLDFHDDHGAYCGNMAKRERWRDTVLGHRGPEILAIVQDCPLLEHVALLYHGDPSATWVEFRTDHCPGPRVILEYDSEHVDSEPINKEWLTT